MDYVVVISAVVLGLSVLATAAKFLDWFLHSDPKTMVRTIRWMLLLLVIAGIPLLVMMLLREQWAGAMLLGSAMLVVPTLLKWRAVLAPLRTAFDLFRRRPQPFEMPPVWQEPASPPNSPIDPRALQHAAALLEAYVRHATPIASSQRQIGAPAGDDDGMSVKEALDVLGLPDGADLAAVHAAHRRLMRGADPDAGGSPYLAAKIDEARDVLVSVLRRPAGPVAVEGPALSKRDRLR
ncbi:MAG: hypothetical protein EPO67_09985 [Reyranella sp.]|nr:MAG: hypothetical protein EPO67_09985 [Reyranella sp.]